MERPQFKLEEHISSLEHFIYSEESQMRLEFTFKKPIKSLNQKEQRN